MTLVQTLLVRDEEDIIETTLLHHLNQGVDKIIITDNGSIDHTMDICQSFVGKGVVEIIQEPPADFSQHKYVSHMANLAVEKYKADWIIHGDADEFFVSRKFNNLKEALKSIPQEQSVLSINRHDFVPTKLSYDHFKPDDFPYRKTRSLNLAGRPLPPKVIHRKTTNIVVSQGNHTVKGEFLSEAVSTDSIEILHYPIRSYDQFVSKVRNGGSGYAKNQDLKPRQGFHKRHWYKLLESRELREEFNRHFYDEEKLTEALQNNLLQEDTYLIELLS